MRFRRRATKTAACAAAVLLFSALLTVVGATPASAELQHPRQEWMRNSQGGLFIHWGMRTAPAHTDCRAWEQAVADGGWDPNYWVDQASKLHADYITFASFHSRLGYARAWPSRVPGSCATNRDFLGQLISAANARGMRVMLYITDDPQWFAEGLPSGRSWLNSSAYSAWKGRNVNLHTRDGFGEFSADVMIEAAQRYPNLDGIWIDNNNAFWNRSNLRERIRQIRPNMLLTENNEDFPIHDMVSHEEKSGMTPAYDYAQGIGTALPRIAEADYRVAGHWWFTGGNPTVNTGLNVGKYMSNVGSGFKVLLGMGAQKNGRFPSNLEAFNNFMNGFLSEIRESIELTEGGGYMHGGLKPGFWNDGAHGVTTVKKNNPNLHYIHVLTRPSGSTLRVRDNNYQIARVTNLRTGQPVSFSQGGGFVTLSGITNWHQFDTVFRVETAGRTSIYPVGSVTATATASAGGAPASRIVDGNYLTWWDSNRTLPVSIHFDLGSQRRVTSLAINQREWTPVHPRDGRNEQSAHIRDYRVFVSNDGTNWGSPIRTARMPNHRGVQFIDLNVASTRFVRLEVRNTYATNSGMNHFRLLGIDEAWIVGNHATGGVTPPPPNRVEAENCTIPAGMGAVESTHAGFSGNGYVNYTNAAGTFIECTVTAAEAGTATLRIGYANGVAANRPIDLAVNGATQVTGLAFPGTGAWTTYQTVTTPVTLAAGQNTIRFTATAADGAANLDYVELA